MHQKYKKGQTDYYNAKQLLVNKKAKEKYDTGINMVHHNA